MHLSTGDVLFPLLLSCDSKYCVDIVVVKGVEPVQVSCTLESNFHTRIGVLVAHKLDRLSSW